MAITDELLMSTTPASNTTLGASITLDGTVMTPSQVDDAFRQQMAYRAAAITRHVTKAAGTYTPAKADYNQFWRCTGAVTLNLTAAATLTDGWALWVRANGGAVTIDPNGAETIDGAATFVLADGQAALIICNGSTFYTVVQGTASTVTGQALTVTYTDAGASGGPDLVLDRLSSSPAVNDVIGRILANGRNSAAATITYGLDAWVITDPTAGTEDSSRQFYNYVNGVLTFQGGYTATGWNTMNIGATVPGTGAFTTFSSTNGTFNGATALNVTYTDNGATGPTMTWMHESASPAVSDILALLKFNGRDSGANLTNYANIYVSLDDPTNGSEDATINFQTMLAGTVTQKASIFDTGFAVSGTASALINPAGAVAGVSLSSAGAIATYVVNAAAAAFGRSNSGTLVNWFTAGTNQGSVSEAAGTVTYGAFCGAHWGQFDDGERRDLLPGTIIETIDEMCEWPHDGDHNPNLTLPKIRISSTEASRRVYGIFSHWDDDDEVNGGDLHVAALGAKFVRIAKGVTVAGGDLLESNGDGCARVQADDLFRSSTIAKVIAAVAVGTYDDGSYIVPCTLHCG